jgi:hypothetical protein
MPDRQRHGRLSDVFVRPPDASARVGRPDGEASPSPAAWEADADEPRRHEPVSSDTRSNDRTRMAGPGGPLWPSDPRTETVELSRPARRRTSSNPADPDSSPDLDRDSEGDGDEPIRSRSARPSLGWPRRRLAVGAACVAAVCALLALPLVRAEVRNSFTRLPQPYTALYFATPPQVDGTVLTLPISVHAVHTGTDAYSVRVWTVDAGGRVYDSRTAGLKWDGQAMSVVVSMPVNPKADYVWVSLGGSDQTLHYKIAVA